jgi:predicted TIM-barrel fold metal-dependent hydrolase
VDRFNERYEELKDFPEWSFNDPQLPKKETLLSQTENLVKRHPKTIFVMAHMGSNSENLQYVDYLMNKYPNYYVDIAAVIAELGRQPYTARKFFIKYQDRIIFGTDGGYGLDKNGLWPPEKFYRTYFEFLETNNEYFEYQLWGTYTQGRWRIYGIDLPDEVLEKIYYRNADKLLYKNQKSYK